jgi:tetratricopeptide (TPR) repeat protein
MNDSGTYPFGGVLRGFREREGLSQQTLARKLGIHRNTLGGWERGDYLPDTHANVLKIAEALQLNELDEDILLTARYNSRQAGSSSPSPTSPTPIWKLPHRRNSLFTGRDDILAHLHNLLTSHKIAAIAQPQAISGLGGIGKTQAAIEYAYRHRQEYTHLFWIRAETREEWTADFVSIALALNLAEKDHQDQNRIIEEVKTWLSTHTDWLLILDNVEHIEYIEDFLPLSYQGSVLLTTRSYLTGTIAHAIELDKMSEDEGCLFLLKRATLLPDDQSLKTIGAEILRLAKEIVQMLDGLPLALDQAGAYIYETQCGIASYLTLYQRRHMDLLKRRGHFPPGHLESVASTLALSIEKVAQINPLAVDLLRLCSFCAPDAIPEEIISEGSTYPEADAKPEIQDQIVLDAMVEALLRYSLIRRNAKHYTLTIHRLVQAVLMESMKGELQMKWAKRAVQAINHAFPSEVAYATWPQCQRYLSHALTCTEWISQLGIEVLDAAQLLDRCGIYLQARTQYTQAEPLFQHALTMYQHLLGPDHQETATVLSHLAYLYQESGRFAQAEPLFLQTLTIQQRTLGTEHTETARSCNNLALLYLQQGKYTQAEPLFQQALLLNQRLLAPEHPDLAAILGNLALLCCKQNHYTQAESLYQQVLTMNQKIWGQIHPRIALSLNDLAFVYTALGKYAQAKPIYEQALVIWDQTLGSEHPNKAVTLHNLARLHQQMGEYSLAESLFQQALTIRAQKLGQEHPQTASILYSLAKLYVEQKKYAVAETLLTRALAIRQRSLGALHPDTQACQELYAQLPGSADHSFV